MSNVQLVSQVLGICLLIAGPLLLFLNPQARALIVASSKPDYRLPFSPTRLKAFDVGVIVLLIARKYIYNTIGLHPRLEVSSDGTGFQLPDLQLSAPLVIDKSDLARFSRAVQHTSSSSSSSTSSSGEKGCGLFLLPACTTPMMLILLAHRRSPILPFGSVNVRNRFEFLDPRACRGRRNASKVDVVARLCAHGRRVRRGVEYDVVVELAGTLDGGEERVLLFRQVVTLLQSLPQTTAPRYVEPERDTSADAEGEGQGESAGGTDTLVFASDAPARWTAVCSDYNPIHVSAVAARAFGLPGKIAHGNHVAASVVQARRADDGRAPELREMWWRSERPSWLEVGFKRPVVLPASVEVRYGEGARGQQGFEVYKGEKVYVSGTAGYLT